WNPSQSKAHPFLSFKLPKTHQRNYRKFSFQFIHKKTSPTQHLVINDTNSHPRIPRGVKTKSHSCLIHVKTTSVNYFSIFLGQKNLVTITHPLLLIFSIIKIFSKTAS